MGPPAYYTMIRSKDHRFDWRLHLVLYAQLHGQRAAARDFRCSRRTPGFGAERLKHEFDLPCGISAIKRILKQHGLTPNPDVATNASEICVPSKPLMRPSLASRST